MSLFGGLFNDDKSDNSSEQNTTIDEKPVNITDQRAATGDAFIGGNVTPTAEEIGGDFNVTMTDGGAFKLIGDNLKRFFDGSNTQAMISGSVQESALDLGKEAIFSNAELSEGVLRNQTNLVNDVLQRDSILTAQTLSKLQAGFDSTADVLAGQQAELGMVTDALGDARTDSVAGQNKTRLALVIMAGGGLLFLVFRKGKK